jgi:hypothetical protein
VYAHRELAREKFRDRYVIFDYSYHLQPHQGTGLDQFRVDLEEGRAHANPSPATERQFRRHAVEVSETVLDLADLNLAIFLTICLQYLKAETYPLTPGVAHTYNRTIARLKRRLGLEPVHY